MILYLQGIFHQSVSCFGRFDISSFGTKIVFRETYGKTLTAFESISERSLADRIYRNRDNLAFCKKYGIRLSELGLGRPKKDAMADKKRNILTMPTKWKLKDHSALPKGAMDLAGSWQNLMEP